MVKMCTTQIEIFECEYVIDLKMNKIYLLFTMDSCEIWFQTKIFTRLWVNAHAVTNIYTNVSVYNLRLIRPMSSDTFLVLASLHSFTFLLRHYIWSNNPFLYAPIPLDLQMKSCMPFIQSCRCIEERSL